MHYLEVFALTIVLNTDILNVHKFHFEKIMNAINFIKSKDINEIVTFQGSIPTKKKKIFEILKINQEEVKEKESLILVRIREKRRARGTYLRKSSIFKYHSSKI